ncbi:MAG: 2-hydroxyacyl-CoA dehydratase family protein [Dehalococcoidia bacterium]|nr:2-hydroxyacyl-CoA dehydratase family protein [Dehalococcoidia bacterium]
MYTEYLPTSRIKVYDTNRRLTQKLYDLQKENPPRLSGADILKVVLASQLMDKAEHNKLLEESSVRLMLIASEVDDVEFVELIESLGATIVVDDNCVGTRYFMGEVGNSTKPIAALAERYARGKPAVSHQGHIHPGTQPAPPCGRPGYRLRRPGGYLRPEQVL